MTKRLAFLAGPFSSKYNSFHYVYNENILARNDNSSLTSPAGIKYLFHQPLLCASSFTLVDDFILYKREKYGITRAHGQLCLCR